MTARAPRPHPPPPPALPAELARIITALARADARRDYAAALQQREAAR